MKLLWGIILTWSSAPTALSACRPRSESAKLMERPATYSCVRGSGGKVYCGWVMRGEEVRGEEWLSQSLLFWGLCYIFQMSSSILWGVKKRVGWFLGGSRIFSVSLICEMKKWPFLRVDQLYKVMITKLHVHIRFSVM